jgi:cell wall-associated NlpC family hydrolase
MVSRETVVACARSWIGTRFQHQGRVKATAHHRGGVDCLGLLMGVAETLALPDKHAGLLIDHDQRCYPHYPNGQEMMCCLINTLYPIDINDLDSGDVGLFLIDGNPQHLALFTGKDRMIHAYAPAHLVVEQAVDAVWQTRLVACFRLPGISS